MELSLIPEKGLCPRCERFRYRAIRNGDSSVDLCEECLEDINSGSLNWKSKSGWKYNTRKRIKKCLICSKEFTGGAASRFCSNYCTQKHFRHKNLVKKGVCRTIKCLHCNKEVTVNTCNRKFCCKKCSVEFQKEKRDKTKKSLEISTSKIGTIGELLVCADLLKRKFEVFRSISSACSCDLIILFEKKSYRVEVTTCSENSNGKVFCPKKDKTKFDVLAVVFHDGRIVYTSDILDLNL